MRAFLLPTLALLMLVPLAAAEPLDPIAAHGQYLCKAVPAHAPPHVLYLRAYGVEQKLKEYGVYLEDFHHPRWYCESTMRDLAGTRGIDIEIGPE